MQYISNLFKRNFNTQKCNEHKEQALNICYEPKCMSNRKICRLDDCKKKHLHHKTTQYFKYKQSLAIVERHLKIRGQIRSHIQKYKKSIQDYIQKLIKEMEMNLFKKIDRLHTPKIVYIEQEHRQKKDYTPSLYQFDQKIPEQAYQNIVSILIDKQKSIHKIINKQEISIDKIQIALNIQNINPLERQTQTKIKDLLPFKCDLKLKFRASQNQFLSKKMHNLNLRGPIVLYVKSHKDKQFGGYSTIMFPSFQEEDSMENRNIYSFLFSLNHKQILHLKEQYRKCAILGGKNFGFGRGDLLISDQCHKGNISWAQIGRAYKQPSNIKGPLNQWIGGASYFRVVQYEIYSVQNKRQK